MSKNINIFIQARMSSSRYPGKVLSPVNGIPLIKNVIDSVRKIQKINKIVVLTGTDESDDPLVAYLISIKCLVFRGNLKNVFDRFQNALKIYPCDYFVRLSADSPFIDFNLVQYMVNRTLENDYLLISNVFVRKFPKGQSVEIIKSQIISGICSEVLNDFEKEHVIPYFYKTLNRNKCLYIELKKDLSQNNQCIDIVDDIKMINDSFFYKFNIKDIREVSLKTVGDE